MATITPTPRTGPNVYAPGSFTILFFSNYMAIGVFDSTSNLYTYDLRNNNIKVTTNSDGDYVVSTHDGELPTSSHPLNPSVEYVTFKSDTCIIGTGDVRGITANPYDGTIQEISLASGCSVIFRYITNDRVLRIYRTSNCLNEYDIEQ